MLRSLMGKADNGKSEKWRDNVNREMEVLKKEPKENARNLKVL